MCFTVCICSVYAQTDNDCGLERFRCRNGECITGELLCNGRADCKDSSDETEVECKKIPCTEYSFRCNYGGCINKHYVCNGNQDCVDNSDETQLQCRTITGRKNQTKRSIQCETGSTCNNEIRCKALSTPSVEARCTYGVNDEWVSCESRVLPGTKAALACRNNYRRETNLLSSQRDNVRCNANGQWEPEPIRCVPDRLSTRPTVTPRTPVTKTCKAPPQPQNGHWKLHRLQCPNGRECIVPEGTELGLGSYLIYSCNPGYKIRGPTNVTCSIEAKWLSIPVCTGTNGQEPFKCPDDFGFYPHHISCDKYWKCDNNVAELKTCGNGLAFDSSDNKFLTENCDYLYKVDCGERTQLEPPISTPHCVRLYGIFPDEKKCDVFWNCWNGEASRYQCSPGLAYDREARVCIWADQVPECRKEEVAGGFTCPAAGEVSRASSNLSRYAHPEDCRKYYICLEGIAREYSCPIGTVFKIGDADGSGACEDPKDVPGCEDYYGDLDLKSIRKSELLADIQSEPRKPAVLKPRLSTVGGPTRPSPL